MGTTDGYRRHVEALGTPAGWARAYPALLAAGREAVGDVLAGLRHPDWRVRKWCAAFLDHFADARCGPALEAALRDPAADVRRHAVHAVGCQACKPEPLGVDAVGLLLDRALADPSARVRRAAAHLLGTQPADARVPAALGPAIGRAADRRWRANARWAVGRHLAAAGGRRPGSGRGGTSARPPDGNST